MPQLNLVSGKVLPGDLEKILGWLAEMRALLPFLLNLSSMQRMNLLKMADKSVAFVQKTGAAAEANRRCIPASIDLAEFASDRQLYDALVPIHTELTQIKCWTTP